FASIAFIGVLGPGPWWELVWSNYVFKVGVEILLFPLTALVVGRVKRAEGADVYDRETRFSPFLWRD
ncbi:MAG: VUT family protein, partial [Candidatus Adiutrix sp.]|nr:VUT family protein [Candidatus Adiutrix sp.]